MFQFSCIAQNATEGYEAFRFAQTWAGKFHGLLTFVDEAMDTTHTWVEFEKAELYFAHFRIGEKSLGSESLIEILVDLGADQAVAEDAVRESRKFSLPPLTWEYVLRFKESPATGESDFSSPACAALKG